MLDVDLRDVIAGAILGALLLYSLSGGADFGGGFWDLVAWGPRRAAQRRLIHDAIGPIWEANHVWLILVVVLLFTAFPLVFTAISVALHVPLTIALLGIVLRGAAFAFRAHGRTGTFAERWGRVFGWASTITPVALGVALATLSTGGVADALYPGRVHFFDCFIRPWLAPFPFAVGAFVLATFAFLAAVYLVNEAREEALREDFRLRAIGAAFVVGLLAEVALAAAPPILKHRLWSFRPQFIAGALACGAIVMLWQRSCRLARLFAIGLVAAIVVEWGTAMHPYLIYPGWSISMKATERATLRPLLWALVIGAMVLFPSFYWLMRVFKGKEAFSVRKR